VNSRRTYVIVGLLIGGFLGVVIVRTFLLDPFEQVGWTLFWRALAQGQIMDWGIVLQSSTFLKCLLGFVFGGAIGAVAARLKEKLGIPQSEAIPTAAKLPMDWNNAIRSHSKSIWERKGVLKAVAVVALSVLAIGVARYVYVERYTFISESKKEPPRLFPVCDRCGTKDARWGFIDSTGKLVIHYQFEQITDFSDGVAAAQAGDRWGFVDEAGNFVINPQFSEAGSFADGLVAVKVDYHQWGYVDKSGKYAIDPKFDAAGIFSEGRAAAMVDYKWGYIDTEGKYTINPQFDDARKFSEGLAAVKFGSKWGFVNRRGKYIANPQFDEIGDAFSEGLSAFRIGDKWGYIDEEGKYAINPQFDSAGKFSEGLAVVQSGDKWGYVDRNGKYTISPQFAKAEDFSESFAAVKLVDQWGYIDKAGKIVINPQFNGTSVGAFRRGLAMIASNIYINAKAEWVWPSPKLFQSDFAQIEPLLSADRPPSTENDGIWNLCANNIATRPLCFTLRKGDATEYGKVLFHDRKAAQVAAKLQFDQILFEDEHGRTLFAMKSTTDGWVPFPGVPAQPFMLETVPDLPSLPDAANGDDGTPVTPVSAQANNQ